jgi:hypothetical protein
MIDVVRLVETPGDPERRALILPGRAYTAQGPLLWYPSRLLESRDWTVTTVDWGQAPESPAQAREVYSEVLRSDVTAHPYSSHLVIAKSLGTVALPVAVVLGVPGVWATPLLSRAHGDLSVRAAAGVAVGSPPALFAGGTADQLWDRSAIARSARVFEVEDANHSLEVPDDWRASVVVLSQYLEAVEEFVDEVEAARGAEA